MNLEKAIKIIKNAIDNSDPKPLYISNYYWDKKWLM